MNTEHASPVDWPEVAAGSQAPMVCDGCHASLAQIRETGHVGICSKRGIHQHHISQPITDCVFWREWEKERAEMTGQPSDLAAALIRRFTYAELDVLQERLRPFMNDDDPMAVLWEAVRDAQDD